MKVLLVNDYGRLQGGAEILAFQLREGLRKLGHDARLFSSDAGDIDSANLADYTCRGTTSCVRTLLQSFNPLAAISLRRVMAEFRPDVVHVTMFLSQLSPLILPLLKNVPAIHHIVWYRPICPLGSKLLSDGTQCRSRPGLVCHDSGCLPWRDWLPLMGQLKLYRRWIHVFDVTVANSIATQQRLMAEGIGPAEVIPNGVPVPELSSGVGDVPTVAFAGRLVREKGVDILLQAFAQVRRQIADAKLIICGDGPERQSVLNLIRELGLSGSVVMRGFVPPEETKAVFRSAWVTAVPSIWEEPFGLVAVEAMMLERAVVASATGGLLEIVEHGRTGLLVAPGNSEELAAALLELLRNRQLAEMMGSAGRQLALTRFTQAKMIERFLGLYQSLVSRGPVQ
jgi:glycosyltransferase involved in cell wall biosynthesis